MTGPKPFEEVEQEMLASSPRQQRPPTSMAAAALEAMQRPGRDPWILLGDFVTNQSFGSLAGG